MHEFMVCLAFLEVSFFFGYHDFHGQKQTVSHPVPQDDHNTWPSEDGGQKLCDIFLYSKSRQWKQCRRDKQMANELSLSVWWLMWAELVYLLTYLPKRSVPCVGSSSAMWSWGGRSYTAHSATYTQHRGIKHKPSNHLSFSYNDKSHPWPFPGPGS